MHRRTLWVAAALWLLPAAPPAAPTLDAQEAPTLAALSFLSGCWAGTMGSLDMREQWSEAEGGVMMGTTRYLREGRVADWEFALIFESPDGVTLLPYPRGSKSEHDFPLVKWDDHFVFENLEHDFPVRIVYVRDGEDGLSPRIEGRDGDARGWSLQRVDCPSGD